MKSLNAAGRLYSQPWPEAALNLSQDVTGTGLPYLVQATNKPIVELYRQVSELMSRLITVLGDFADSNKDVQPVRELLVTNLKSVNAPKTVSDSSVQEFEQALQKLNDDHVDGAIRLLQSNVASIKRSVVAMTNNTNAGVGAVGGINSNYPPAPSGNTGKDGQADGARTAENLPFDGTEKDAAFSQAYAFLDQCQMLLSKADKSFFANTTDMFGHSPDWAPRLSFDYYKEEVERELADLKDVERVTDNYLKALEEGQSKIQLLTSSNGPLTTNAFKIATFTPLIEEKRADIEQRFSNVTVHSTSDPRMILEALATLTSIKPSFSSLVDLSTFGYDAYKSTTVATDVQGNKFNKAYVIYQLATCGNTLLSLSTSVSIEEKYRKELSDALDDYVDTILMRNDAILEYNAAIQLLFEAESDRQYYLAQAEKLGEEGITAAIRFWRLLDDIPLLEPGALPSYTYLQSSQAHLRGAAENAQAFCIEPGQDIHTAVVSLPEHTVPFAGRADIRLNQVRLWLFPVTLDASDGLGRKFLSIQLIHTGNETILDDDDTSYKFTHDAVYIDFEYNVDNIKKLPDIQGAEVRVEQQIQDHTMGTSTGKSAVAALGPFTKWQVMIKTSNVSIWTS
ncbi:hypothetical protein CA14_010669 [Aspergillus flavus]|uniref:Tc toxin complex TcA C-terminal TcB-binding domain-containing protein n=1 Tax=Aspergillus flavus TaxID=5059 RepID=A0AB74C7B0_ASPFL|nr:hypothetical protein CA14_010669 [Aspergillus flavus]